MVISDIPPEFELKSLVFRKWNKDTEISDLLLFNVGVMPLLDDKWANGKCGFKALQYMALGIPALVSPVGVNTQIVDDGMNGFVCNSADEWENSLRLLLSNRSELERISSNTRKKIELSYSVKSNTANFLQLFKNS
jgi:glycosyltransferase involved in cell wall biosynthesis